MALNRTSGLWLLVTMCYTLSNTFVNAQSPCELESEKPCGDSWHNPKDAFCCREVVHFYKKNISSGPNDCCNGSPYNSFTHVCCEGCLHPRNDTKLMCCGKGVYTPRSQTCCGGAMSKKDFFLRCCGGKIYNRATHKCCRDVTYPIAQGQKCCGAFVYDVTSHRCCSDCIHRRINPDRCCGVTTYNHLTQICCDGVVWKSGLPCCGKKQYDYRSHMCCGTQILKREVRTNKTSCCHNRETGEVSLYDFAFSRCCDGTVVTSRKGRIASRTRCCSNLLYQPDMYSACCSHVIYNPVTHACCKGNLSSSVNLKKRHHQCCNGLYYDSTKAKCCCGKILYTDDIRGTGCCGGKLFKLPGVCCRNKWFPRYKRCCGPKPLKSYKWLCCNQKYGLEYYPRVTACCDGLLVPAERLEGNTWVCCGIALMDTRKDICCEGCFHRYRDDITNACCAKVSYDPATHICCTETGTVHPRAKYNRCCSGLFPYNTATHRCCYYARVVPRNKSCF